MNTVAGRMRISVLLVLFFRAASASAGAAAVPQIGSAENAIHEEMTAQHIPGMAVAIIDKGRVVLARGYGLANVEHDVPVTPETVFQSGSVGKQFTATAIL